MFFGSYEQDDGVEPIEWLVLDADSSTAVLISTRVLSAQRMNDRGYSEACTWQTSTLRAWLNGPFCQEAFTEAERASIVPVTLDNGGSSLATEDRIYILSDEEYRAFSLTPGRPTAHAAAMQSHGDCAQIWLRKTGIAGPTARYVKTDGTIDLRKGDNVYLIHGVQPCIRVSLDAPVR